MKRRRKYMNKKIEEEKFKAYSLLFNAITDALATIEAVKLALEKAHKEAEKIYIESTDKLNINIY